MAKQRKPKGFVDPLDSIFGFIFGNAKSKPVKTRPARLSGVNTSEILARGLAEIAARPANYVGDAVMGPVNEMANSIKLSEFQLDNFDDSKNRGLDNSAGRFRVRSSDIGKFLMNPNRFVDSVFAGADEERKWARYLNVGRGMDTALMAAWAKKQGFSNKEALAMGFASSDFIGPDQILEGKKKFNQNLVLNNLSSLQTNRVPKDVLKQVWNEIGEYKGTGFKNQADLDNVLKRIPGLASRPDYNALLEQTFKTYQDKTFGKEDPGTKQRKGGVWDKGVDKGGLATEGKLNRYGYISILSENYLNQARLLDSTDPAQAEQQRKILAARQALNTILRIKGPGYSENNMGDFANVIDTIDKQIDFLDKKRTARGGSFTSDEQLYFNEFNRVRADIDTAIQQGNAALGRKESRRLWGFERIGDYSQFRKAMIAEVEWEIKKAGWDKLNATTASQKGYYDNVIKSLLDRQKSLVSAPLHDWRIITADLLGAYKSIDGNLLKGGLAGGLITGSFFAGDGFMSPGHTNTLINLRRYDKSKYGKDWMTKVPLAREDINKNYAALTKLYYFTPGSLVKTFAWNGEGFAYLMYQQRIRNINRTFDDASFNTLVSFVNGNTDLQKFYAGEGFKLTKENIINNFPVFMQGIQAHGGALEPGLLSKLNNVFKTDQSGVFGTALRIFGSPQRAFGRLGNWFETNFRKKGTAFLMKNVYPKIFSQTFVSKIAITGGIRQAISVVVSEALVALGTTVGGPIGAALGFLLTVIAEDVIGKLMKPFIKAFFAFMWFVIFFIIGLLGLIALLFFGSHPQPQQHLTPTDYLQCVEENPFQDLYKDDPVLAGGNYGNAPENSTCPILSPSMNCTQGDGEGSSNYHRTVHGLDIGASGLANPVWYAPTNGTVTSFSGSNACPLDGIDYGGILHFVDSGGNEYVLMHVKALASGPVTKGKPVAIIQMGLKTSDCWTGAHFHLEVKSKGKYVDDTEGWYRTNLKCNINPSDTTCHG